MTHSFLYLFFLLLPFQFAISPTDGIDLAVIRILSIGLFLGWLIRGIIRRKITLSENIITPLILSFIYLAAFSIWFAENPSWGLRKFIFLLTFFPLYFVFTDLLRNKSVLIQTLRCVIFSSTFAAVIGIIQFIAQFFISIEQLFRFWTTALLPFFLGNTFSHSIASYPSLLVNISGKTMMRATAFFPDPHMFSYFLGMTLPLAIGLALTKDSARMHTSWWRNHTMHIAAITIGTADLLTFSRGGYLGLFAGIIFIIGMQFSTWTRNTKKLFFIMLVTVFTMLSISPIGNRFITSFNIKEGSNQGRIVMWQSAMRIIQQHPLIGVGLGNYSREILPSASYRDPIYAHNLFLDIAAETGIINALIFLGIVSISIMRLIKKSKLENLYIWPAVSLIIFTTHSLVETPLFSVHILPLLLLIISMHTDVKDT